MFGRLTGVYRRLMRGVLRRGDVDAGIASIDPMMLSGHEDILTVSRRLQIVKSEIDRSLYELRDWSRELEQRLDPLQDELVRTRNLRTLGETVGGLAHNFNNSLAAIVSYTELLLRESQDDTAQRRLAIIRQVALEAAGSLRHLQEFVARQTHMPFGPVSLDSVLTEALALTEPRWRDEAERHGVRVSIVRQVTAAPPVEGNPADLRDVFVHLILGAVSAMSTGGELTIRAWGEDSGWVTVTIADPARGARQVNVAAAIIERQGGSLSMESSAAGTTVTLRLLGSRYQVIPTATAMAAADADRARRIALVDDDPRLLRALTDLLSAHGHTVSAFGSGRELLEFLETAGVDLVITDLGMPEMTGWEVAAAVKARRPGVPVFLLTGWGADAAADARSLLVDRVIPKPLSLDALLSHVGSVERSEGASAAPPDTSPRNG
jgi:CheY-like chemotaxis protein